MALADTLAIDITARVIPILFHILGIYSLIQAKIFIERSNKAPSIYLFWLSTMEILANLMYIIVLSIKAEHNQYGIIYSQMALALISLTIDRVALVYLNIKYSQKKDIYAAKWIVFASCVFSSFIALMLFLMVNNLEDFSKVVALYYWPVFDFIVVIVFVVSYLFIYKMMSVRTKALNRSDSRIYLRRMKNATIVPKLILLSFIFLWTAYDVVYFVYEVYNIKMAYSIIVAMEYLVFAAYSTDAICYIYFCRPIKRMWKKRLSNIFRRISCRKKQIQLTPSPVPQICRNM